MAGQHQLPNASGIHSNNECHVPPIDSTQHHELRLIWQLQVMEVNNKLLGEATKWHHSAIAAALREPTPSLGQRWNGSEQLNTDTSKYRRVQRFSVELYTLGTIARTM